MKRQHSFFWQWAGCALTGALLMSCAEETAPVSEPVDTASDTSSATEAEDSRYAPSALPPALGLGSSFLVIDHLLFPFQEEDGTCIGFNLDDDVSVDDETGKCGWGDFTSIEGTLGIDNNLARLTPLFDSVGLGQAFPYLQDSIESSGFYLLWELHGVDNLENDEEVDVVFQVGGGAGILGTDGDLVSQQTLCIQNDSPATPALTARIQDGWIEAEFESLTFPLVLFERVYEFVFLNAHIRGKLDGQGGITEGVVGGILTLDNLLQLAEKGGQNQGGLYETIQFILEPMGDMDTEAGPCTGLSSAFSLTSVPIFVYPEDMECDTCGNGICESFESCETCLEDCCPNCGDGICDVYPQEIISVQVQTEGFVASAGTARVGDAAEFINQTDKPKHLLCENLLDVTPIQPGETVSVVFTNAGTFEFRTLEGIGSFATFDVGDNYSETCQSCPSDCPDGC